MIEARGSRRTITAAGKAPYRYAISCSFIERIYRWLACLWMLAAKCSVPVLLAPALRLDKESLIHGVGEVVGIFRCSLALIRGSDLRAMLED
jgi:hypothetical protein